MEVKDAVDLLEMYQKYQQVSDSEASHVMSNLVEISYYPELFIIPGGIEFNIIKQRYGGPTTFLIFEFLGEVFSGKTAVTNFSFDNRFSQKVQQDNDVVGVVFELYMRVWMELRKNGMSVFPYRLGQVGKQGGLYVRADKFQLLQHAGL